MGTRSSRCLWETGITGESGSTMFPDPLETPGPRIPSERRVHVVTWNSEFPWSHVNSGSGVTVTPGSLVTRNSGFPESQGISVSRSHPELRVPGSPGSPGQRSNPDPWVPGVIQNSGSHSPRTPGSRIHQNSRFPESPRTLGSQIRPKLRVPGLIRNSGSRSHPECCFPKSPGSPGSRSQP